MQKYRDRDISHLSHRVKDATRFEDVENNFKGEKLNKGKSYQEYLKS